jgi:hypothetical protein
MKIAVIVCGILSLLIWSVLAVSYIGTSFAWERDYGSKWELADRASTIKAKADLVASFLNSIELSPSRFSDHNAIFLRTDQNSLKRNLDALRTLSLRLEEISMMDPRSPEYQWAIQQITAQEQGEAEGLIGTIRGCFFLGTMSLAWGWIGISLVLMPICMWCVLFVVAVVRS